jgi:RHS repeat-associated protein
MRAQEVFAVAVSTDQKDTNAYKVFNSGTAADHVPTLNVTYGDDCQIVDGYYICDEIKDKYNADGGEGRWGVPTNDTTGTSPRPGSYQDFSGDESVTMFWSPGTGAHVLSGCIRDKYAELGWENGWLGFPTGDVYSVQNGVGRVQDFEHGSIYWSEDTGAHALRADFVAHYRTVGAQDGYLGYPTSDSYDFGSGSYAWFTGGSIAWDRQSNAFQHFADYPSLGGQPGWATQLDYQLSDTVNAKVNVGIGNLNVSIAGLAVPGIGQDRSVGLTYNSFAAWGDGQSWQGSLVGPLFRLTDAPDTRLAAYADQSVRYIDPSGRVLLYRWNGSGYEAPVGDGGTKLERNAAKDWVLTTLSSQRKQTFRASDGLLISDADRNGNNYSFDYDANGLPTSITGTRGGAPITFTVDGDGYLTSMRQSIDGVVRTIGLGYDGESGLLTSVTDASGNTTTFEWTDWDLTSVTDPRGNTTAFQYDDTHSVVQVVRDYGGANLSTGLAWDTENRNGVNTAVTRVTTPNDQVTNYTVDAFGKVLDATDPLWHKKATTYSPNNDVATAVDAMPAANTTTYSYNGADGGYTPTGVTAPTGASATASYPATGNGPQRYQPTSSTDTQGNTTTYAYDTAGNPTQQATGGVITSTTYNPPAGQPTTCGGKPGQPCTTTDGRGNTTTFTYDASGNLVTVTPPASGVIEATHYTYDGAGRPKTVTDGNNRVTTYIYDKNDRVTQVRYNGATSCSTAADCEVYTYDAAGNLTKRVDGSGTTKYGYDSLNRLSTEVSPAASGGGAKTATLTYDLAGNLVSYADANGTTKYGYDAGNNLIWLAEPGGSCTGTVSKCTRYEYNGNDARTKITYPGGTTVNYLNIDASGRPLQYKATKSTGQVFMDFTYNYTGGNGDTSLVQSRSDATVAGSAVQTYTYDGLNRLTRALEKVGANTTASWTYCYDAAGNRTYDSTSTDATVPCPGDAGGPAATYTYDATNALTGRAGQPASAFSYDGNGAELAAVGTNTRTGATWSTHGQLTAVTAAGTAHSYSYAGEGNKERLTADGTGYQNTPLGVTSQTGTNANQVIREPNGTAVALRVGGVSYYYIADRQGSIISLVSSTGIERNHYSYDPYGVSRTKTEAVTNPWQYIGGELDVSGLYHLQNRYYDPTLGRFTQPDPSGQEENVYLYSEGCPSSNSDPTGYRTYKAVVSCHLVGKFGASEGFVRGTGYGRTPDAALKAAQKDANGSVPRGYHVRHCHGVSLERVGRSRISDDGSFGGGGSF